MIYFKNYRDCGYTCNPRKFEIPALWFPRKVPVNPCKHLQCALAPQYSKAENWLQFCSCIDLGKNMNSFLWRQLIFLAYRHCTHSTVLGGREINYFLLIASALAPQYSIAVNWLQFCSCINSGTNMSSFLWRQLIFLAYCLCTYSTVLGGRRINYF